MQGPSLLILRILGLLEGISFLILMGVAMPLKYAWEDESWMQSAGMAHGLLFVAYMIMLLVVAPKAENSTRFVVWGTLGALLPFGTFVVDAKLFKPLNAT